MSKSATILITGSTDGLGKRVAEKLARSGFHLLIHGRDAARGKALANWIKDAGGTATFYQADFSSLAGVRQLAAAVTGDHEHLDVLVNNAGIADFNGPRQESADGFELNFAVNYLAPALLTRLLLPIMGGSRPSRIVNVSAAGQMPIDFDDVMLDGPIMADMPARRANWPTSCSHLTWRRNCAARTSRSIACTPPASWTRPWSGRMASSR